MVMIVSRRREEGSGRSENAGRCLFKSRTQHHKMVGKKRKRMKEQSITETGVVKYGNPYR